MYEFDHHNHILTILERMRTDFLSEISVRFGGGTLLSLLYGEYRCSKDIDFICSAGETYRTLRSELFERQYDALFSKKDGILLPREIKADQYGVRFVAGVDDAWIKCEIIVEARMALEDPVIYKGIPVPCLGFEDCVSEKLLANADRWADRSVESRDLIDLAALRMQSFFPERAVMKAESAYPVIKPLEKAMRMFMDDLSYRSSCFRSLQVRTPETVLEGVERLAGDFGWIIP